MTKGYYFDKRRNQYIVRVNDNGRRKYIGAYPTEEKALAAYIANSPSELTQHEITLESTDMVFFGGLKTISDAVEDFAIALWDRLFKKA